MLHFLMVEVEGQADQLFHVIRFLTTFVTEESSWLLQAILSQAVPELCKPSQ